MLPRAQRAAFFFPLHVERNVRWSTDPRVIAQSLAQSLLCTSSGIVRTVFGHFGRTQRVLSLDHLSQQLIHLLFHYNVSLTVRSCSIQLHPEWEIPISALTRHEQRLLALLVLRDGQFGTRRLKEVTHCVHDAVFADAYCPRRALHAVLGAIAVLPCGFLVRPLTHLVCLNLQAHAT